MDRVAMMKQAAAQRARRMAVEAEMPKNQHKDESISYVQEDLAARQRACCGWNEWNFFDGETPARQKIAQC